MKFTAWLIKNIPFLYEIDKYLSKKMIQYIKWRRKAMMGIGIIFITTCVVMFIHFSNIRFRRVMLNYKKLEVDYKEYDKLKAIQIDNGSVIREHIIGSRKKLFSKNILIATTTNVGTLDIGELN